ncbi:hypothetical protein F5Y12DRAFT_571948 [Xylaria sp. FL1777]|nr:hypothetical protein F5Y12DRAFT_571948 [Xylaria sp. FL1777]
MLPNGIGKPLVGTYTRPALGWALLIVISGLIVNLACILSTDAMSKGLIQHLGRKPETHKRRRGAEVCGYNASQVGTIVVYLDMKYLNWVKRHVPNPSLARQKHAAHSCLHYTHLADKQIDSQMD